MAVSAGVEVLETPAFPAGFSRWESD